MLPTDVDERCHWIDNINETNICFGSTDDVTSTDNDVPRLIVGDVYASSETSEYATHLWGWRVWRLVNGRIVDSISKQPSTVPIPASINPKFDFAKSFSIDISAAIDFFNYSSIKLFYLQALEPGNDKPEWIDLLKFHPSFCCPKTFVVVAYLPRSGKLKVETTVTDWITNQTFPSMKIIRGNFRRRNRGRKEEEPGHSAMILFAIKLIEFCLLASSCFGTKSVAENPHLRLSRGHSSEKGGGWCFMMLIVIT